MKSGQSVLHGYEVEKERNRKVKPAIHLCSRNHRSWLINGARLRRLQLAGVIWRLLAAAPYSRARDTLRRPSTSGFSPGEAAETRARLKAIARTVTPSVQLDVIKEYPDDNHILECAVSAGADYIVTGDKDLLRLGAYDAIRILTVADFLDQQQHTC